MTRETGPQDCGDREESTAPDNGSGGNTPPPRLARLGISELFNFPSSFPAVMSGRPYHSVRSDRGDMCHGVGTEPGNCGSSKGEAQNPWVFMVLGFFGEQKAPGSAHPRSGFHFYD